MVMAAVQRRQAREIEYASGNGEPLAETEPQLMDMIEVIRSLRDYFAPRPNVCVCGNVLLYYEEGNPRKHVAPVLHASRRVLLKYVLVLR
jgi:hypothetical protein